MVGSNEPLSIVFVGVESPVWSALLLALHRHPQYTLAAVQSKRWQGLPLNGVFPAFIGESSLKFQELDVKKLGLAAPIVILCEFDDELADSLSDRYRKMGCRVILAGEALGHPGSLVQSFALPFDAQREQSLAHLGLFDDNVKNSRRAVIPDRLSSLFLLGLAPLVQEQVIVDRTLVSHFSLDSKFRSAVVPQFTALKKQLDWLNPIFEANPCVSTSYYEENDLCALKLFVRPIRKADVSVFEALFERFYKRVPMMKLIKNSHNVAVSEQESSVYVSLEFDEQSEWMTVSLGCSLVQAGLVQPVLSVLDLWQST